MQKSYRYHRFALRHAPLLREAADLEAWGVQGERVGKRRYKKKIDYQPP